MKRIIVIISFFAIIFGVIILSSCNSKMECVEIVVPRVACDSSYKPTTIRGCACYKESCAIDDSPYAFYWFPFTLGCYGNDTECSRSPVILGVDLMLLECYGKGHVGDYDPLSNREERKIIDAVEGVHYKIDRITLTVDNHVADFGDITTDEIPAIVYEFIKKFHLETAAEIQFCVEYTALTELHSIRMKSTFDYSNDLQHTFGVNKYMGNNPLDETVDALKSNNILPGKHVLVATVSLDMYEVLSLEGISELELYVKAYEE